VLYGEQCIGQVVQAARAVCCVCNVKRRNVPALVECEAVTARRLQSNTSIRNAGHHPGRGVRRRRQMEHKNALKAPIAQGCWVLCALCSSWVSSAVGVLCATAMTNGCMRGTAHAWPRSTNRLRCQNISHSEATVTHSVLQHAVGVLCDAFPCSLKLKPYRHVRHCDFM